MRDREDEIATAELVRRTREGDLPAFEQIVERYRRLVFSIANHFLANREDANDTAQEIFIRIYQYLDSYDTNREFAPWLYKIAVNTCMSEARSRGRRRRRFRSEQSEEGEHAMRTAATPASEEPESRELRSLREVIQVLPEKYRIVCILRYLENLRYEDIAEMTGTSVSAVRGRLSRARHMIEERLKASDSLRDAEQGV